MDILEYVKTFDVGLFIDYFISTYYFVVFIISIGLYTFIDTIIHPLKEGWTSPLQGNYRGIMGGAGFVILGIACIYWHLSGEDYPWLHTDVENPTWEKYTALTILVLSLGRLVYLFFFENFKEKERFRFWIVVLCCALLMLFSG